MDRCTGAGQLHLSEVPDPRIPEVGPTCLIRCGSKRTGHFGLLENNDGLDYVRLTARLRLD